MMYLPVASLLYDDVVHALRDRPAAAAAPPLVVRKVLPAPFAADAVECVVPAVLPKGGELLGKAAPLLLLLLAGVVGVEAPMP